MDTPVGVSTPAPPAPSAEPAAPAPAPEPVAPAPAPEPSVPPAQPAAPAPEPAQPVTETVDPFAASNYALDWNQIDAEADLPEEEKGQPAEAQPPAQTEPPAQPEAKPEEQPAAKPEEQPAQAEPAAEPPAVDPNVIEAVGGQQVYDLTQSLFNAPVSNDQEATVAGRNFVEGLSKYDPRLGNGLLNGVFEHFGDTIGQWYLSEQGITPELLAVAKSLTDSGIDPATFAPQFPQPDADNMVDLNGETLNLDNDRDRRYYETERDKFNDQQQKARQEREAAKTTQATEAQAAQARAAEAAEGFYNTRLSNLKTQFDGLKLNYGEGFEFVGDAIDALSQLYVQRDEALQQQLIQGMDVAARGGEAAKLKGEKVDLMANAHLKRAVDQITALVNQVNSLKAELAGTSPRVPTPPPTPPTNPPVQPQANGGVLPTLPNSATPDASLENLDPWDSRRFRVPDSIFQ